MTGPRVTAIRKKGAIADAAMDARVREVAERARANGRARPPAQAMAVRHDPSIVRENTSPERICRECGDSFRPRRPRDYFCPDCKRES